MKINVFLLGLLLAASCGPGQNNKSHTADSSSHHPDTAVTSSATLPAEDSIAQQIQAPDSLFEDGSKPSSWANAGFDHPAAFKQFLVHFKTWVSTDQTDSIAAHVLYPLKNAANAAAFKKNYAQLFTQQLKTIITRQRLDRIFRNSQGAMLGNGAIWFIEQKNDYFITAIHTQ